MIAGVVYTPPFFALVRVAIYKEKIQTLVLLPRVG